MAKGLFRAKRRGSRKRKRSKPSEAGATAGDAAASSFDEIYNAAVSGSSGIPRKLSGLVSTLSGAYLLSQLVDSGMDFATELYTDKTNRTLKLAKDQMIAEAAARDKMIEFLQGKEKKAEDLGVASREEARDLAGVSAQHPNVGDDFIATLLATRQQGGPETDMMLPTMMAISDKSDRGVPITPLMAMGLPL
jgi:hypothetical protein